jgi:hypothetical protein
MEYFSLKYSFGPPRDAVVTPVDPRVTRCDRLARWASILERTPDEVLWLHRNLELASPDASWLMTAQIGRLRRRLGTLPPALDLLASDRVTALTLAARDPALRLAGLTSERYVVARRFFGLTAIEMHDILCFCAYEHETQVPARRIAERIRTAASAAPAEG